MGKFVSRTAARGVKAGWINKSLAHTINRTGKIATGFGNKMSNPLIGFAGVPVAGMLAERAGIPHASMIANTIAHPGVSMLYAAPNLAQASRLGNKDIQDKIKADAEEGAARAQQDFISAAQMDPRGTFSAPGSYKTLLSDVGVNTGLVDSYMQGAYRDRKPLGFLDKMDRVMTDPQRAVNYEVRNEIQRNVDQAMQKQGSWSSALGTGMKWGGRALGGLFLAGLGKTSYDTVKNLTSERPYDRDAVMQEGYAGAQAALAKKMEGLSGFERRMAQFDPGFAINKLEKQRPGAIAAWEGATGQSYQPGVLSRLVRHVSEGMPASMYSTGLDGSRTQL